MIYLSSLIEFQKKLVPDLIDKMEKRYKILKFIRLLQPIGRRGLTAYLPYSERVLRSEVMILKDHSLLNVTSEGMSLTRDGEATLDELEEFMKDILGLKVLEENLKKKLNIERVVVVSGDSDENELVKKEMSFACAGQIRKNLIEQNIIAVTGGTTLADVAEMMKPLPKGKKAMYVPARGGVGKDIKYQANAICARMAEKSNGEYRLLHVPDQISDESFKSIISEPSVKELMELINSSTMVVHGIGNALEMAERRETPQEVYNKLQKQKAKGEAFGYYFDHNGCVVHQINSIGLRLENIKDTVSVIAVAGGTSKAEAISAYMSTSSNTTLVTDEGAANVIIKMFS